MSTPRLPRLLHLPHFSRPLLCALLCANAVFGAQAATAWDEAVSGDLVNAGTSPTALSLGLGSNITQAPPAAVPQAWWTAMTWASRCRPAGNWIR